MSLTINKKLIYEKFILQLMKNGQKVKAEKLFRNILFNISSQGLSPLPTIIIAVNNVKPLVEIRNVKVKGISYSIPFPLNLKRQVGFGIKFLVNSHRTNIVANVSEEIIKAYFGTGEIVKKTKSLHTLARKNRIFSHYRWF